MKELIEGLLFVALLKFLGVPMWLVSLGSILFLVGFFAYMSLESADSRRGRELAVSVSHEKQQAKEIKEPERARQEADADWNARFV